MRELTGRLKERERLKTLLKSDKPELLTMYGRRRIGKTYLIRSIYKKYIRFEFSGLHNAPLHDQLENFALQLGQFHKKAAPIKKPKNWLLAFHELSIYLDKIRSKNKKVVFIDEFPWLATPRSKFLPAFENFWNNYASKRSDLLVVICGSSASYMVKKIILNKGGLHNRITEKIRLLPFNLHETAQFLKQKGIQFNPYDIIQLYMSIGGIPHYLEQVEKGESVAQNIDRLCFSKDGFMVQEFDNIFVSLFDNSQYHKDIIIQLAKARQGFTRKQIIQSSPQFKSGGTLTKTLNELSESGFITQYTPYKGTIKQSLFRLTDEYSLFYIKFIQGKTHGGEGTWLNFHTQQSYKSWCGFSFESLCLKHIKQLKKALGIDQIYTEQASWVLRNDKSKGEQGAQIDLLIDRADRVINICEMKFYDAEFTISKAYASELRRKISLFRSNTKTRKNVFPVMITLHGLKENSYSLELIQKSIEAKSLFLPD